MSFLKLTKRFIAVIALAVLLSFSFASLTSADIGGDIGAAIGGLFDTGEAGLSFKQYEGRLAELSAEGYAETLTRSGDLREFVVRVVNFALGFLGLAAVIIVIYGGVLYVTAAGEEERTQTGKKAISYAVIGILIVIGSFAFVNTVIRGAIGDEESGGARIVTGPTTTGAFNATNESIRAIALEIADGFILLAQTTDDIKNIQNEATKQSMIPKNLPARTDINSFLNRTKSKLQSVRTRLRPFTVAEAEVNEIIRELDHDIDRIERLNQRGYISMDKPGVCDPDEERGFGEGLIGSSDAKICANSGYNYYYNVGLFQTWEEIYDKYSGVDVSSAIYRLPAPIAESYAEELRISFSRLAEIFAKYENLNQSVQDAQIAYEQMRLEYGYVYDVTNGEVHAQGSGLHAQGSGLLSIVDSWNVETSTTTAANKLMQGLSAQSKLYQELKSLQFVQTRLTADTIEGSAPLPIIFNINDTADPAGGSVRGTNVTWDLAGTKTAAELMDAPKGSGPFETDDVECSLVDPDADPDSVGTTSRRCIFHRPGTYQAQVKIHSNEETKYAPGMSVLQIKVNPPTSEINMFLEAAGQSQTVMRYEEGLLITNKQTVGFTTSDAESGITFNAEETGAAQYKWIFGDGEETDFKSTGEEDHKYKKPGKYEVRLDVKNGLGVEDKKIFNLEVSAIASRLKAVPEGIASVNTTVNFDASDSKSDLGKIVNYKWSIEPSSDQPIPFILRQEINSMYPLNVSGAGQKILDHEFKYPLNYDISVEVTDDARNKDSYKLKGYKVESKAPVAAFDFGFPDLPQPGTVHLNAGPSYDPDGGRNFDYSWSISPDAGWILANDSNTLSSEKALVKFLEKGTYEVKLKVTDKIANEESTEISQTVTVGEVLDVAFGEEQKVVHLLDKETGEVEVEFLIESDNAIAYEIKFGDGESQTGDINEAITHKYTEAGKFEVVLTVYDESDNDNSVRRRFFVGGGDEPVAQIGLSVGGTEIYDFSRPIKVSKKDVISFTGAESKNVDGTGRDLNYSWKFGDTDISSKKAPTHSYRELSPLDPGYYEVELLVFDKDEPGKSDEDTVRIEVSNTAPFFSNVQGVVQSADSDLITPITLSMKAYGPEDEDGQIVQYKWWYFDLDDPDNPLGIQIGTSPQTQLTIGTNGKEGIEVTYGFGLEIMDSDGLGYSNQEQIDNIATSAITVTNGPNEIPEAKFDVDSTNAYSGDKLTFTSASEDPDGNIISYIWDFEGDGFFNNAPTDQSLVEHIYEAKSEEGYSVRLKVIDDKGGEAVSDPIKIVITSLAEPPVAAFTYEVIPGSEGMKIKYTNNSLADEDAGASIIAYHWDFDSASILGTADSNGDGDKANDIDSQATDPERLYIEPNIYKVKLTVYDNQGNIDEVINDVVVPLANPPVAAFTYDVIENQVVFTNNSQADQKAGARIEEYVWDFDSRNADSDGDGREDNDVDSQLQSPIYTYPLSGTYSVRLTVMDSQGNIDSVKNDVYYVSSFISDIGAIDNGLNAAFQTSPVPDADAVVYLTGEKGTVTFDFTDSSGPIAQYKFDKNIYFDTDDNGDSTDDVDFGPVFPGNWTTNFEKAWGRIVTKLTVVDIYGNEDSQTVEIKFK